MFSNWISRLTPQQLQEDSSVKKRLTDEITSEDVIDLQLPSSQIRLLKKTLFHFSRLYTKLQDYHLFAISWDVYNIPKPPDDLFAMLPPDEWEKPEIIAIGLRNVPPEFAEYWVIVCTAAVRNYAFDFHPLIPKPLIENGALLLVYVKNPLLDFIQHLQTRWLSSSFTSVACRFCLHQAPVCIVLVNFCSSTIQIDVRSEKDGVRIDQDAQMALQCQQLRALLDRIEFDICGRLYKISDHPIILFLGCKDYSSASLYSFAFNTNPGGIALSEELNQYSILQKLNFLDLRYSRASEQKGVTKFTGTLDVVKAGVMRLEMEVDDGDGSRIATPEVSMFKIGVPSVDPERLRKLYRTLRTTLTKDEEEFKSVQIQPPILECEAVRPYVPTEIKFTVKNRNENPAAFSVLCLSSDRKHLVPVKTHSLLHRAKLGQPTTDTGAMKTETVNRLSNHISADKLSDHACSIAAKSEGMAVPITINQQRKLPPHPKKTDKDVQEMAIRKSVSNATSISKYLNLPKGSKHLDGDVEKSHSELSDGMSSAKKRKFFSRGWWNRLGGWKRSSSSSKSNIDAPVLNSLITKSINQRSLLASPGDNATVYSNSIPSNTSVSKNAKLGFNEAGRKILSEMSQLNSVVDDEHRNKIHKNFIDKQLRSGAGLRCSSTFEFFTEIRTTPKNVSSQQGLSESNPSSTAVDFPALILHSPLQKDSKDASISMVEISPPKHCYKVFNKNTASLRNRNKQFDLSKWIQIEPTEGVILGGNEIEISVTILVKEAVTEEIQIPSCILAIRLDNRKFDSFFSFGTSVMPSLSGLSLRQLEIIGYDRFRRQNCDNSQFQNIMEENVTYNLPYRQGSIKQLPIPKELWWLLANIYEKTANGTNLKLLEEQDESPYSEMSSASVFQTFSPSSTICTSPDSELMTSDYRIPMENKFKGMNFSCLELTHQIRVVIFCIETGVKIPDAIPVVALLFVLEKWAIELPIPIMPRECITNLNFDPSHILCRAVLLSLPLTNRNLFIAILSLSHHLVHREIYRHHSNEMLLTAAVVEWLARLLLRDTSMNLSIPFLSHFMNKSTLDAVSEVT